MPDHIWTIDDLNRMIENEVPESLTLDYKASPTLKRTDPGKKELAKDVSSFANSAGGRIVIGVIEGKDHKPDMLDGGVEDIAFSRETIEQVLNSQITPRIERLRIFPIPAGENRFYYIIDIPQATMNAPHQVMTTGKYWKRYEFTTVEMQDYEIRDAFRRSGTPILDMELQIVSQRLDQQTGEIHFTTKVMCHNKSATPATYANLSVYVPDISGFSVPNTPRSWLSTGTHDFLLEENGENKRYNGFMMHVMAPNSAPIYKEISFNWGLFDCVSNIIISEIHFITIVSCPGFKRTQSFVVNCLGGHLELRATDSNPPLD